MELLANGHDMINTVETAVRYRNKSELLRVIAET